MADWFGGLASLGGSIFSARSARKSAQEQMRFQERMSSTAHQREVADLRAAGLNPILSGTGGAGSATPPGASYQVPNMGEAFMSGFESSARSSLASMQEGLADEQTRKTTEEADLTRATKDKVLSDRKLIDLQAITEAVRTKLLTAEEGKVHAERVLAEARTETERGTAKQIAVTTEKYRREYEILSEQLKGWVTEGKIDASFVGEVLRMVNRVFNSVPVPGKR